MVCCKDSGDKEGSSLLKFDIHDYKVGQRQKRLYLRVEPLPALHLDNLTSDLQETAKTFKFRGPIDEMSTSASQSLAPRHRTFRLGSHGITDALRFLLGVDKLDTTVCDAIKHSLQSLDLTTSYVVLFFYNRLAMPVEFPHLYIILPTHSHSLPSRITFLQKLSQPLLALLQRLG